MRHTIHGPSSCVPVVACILGIQFLAGCASSPPPAQRGGDGPDAMRAPSVSRDNPELAAIYAADQADRTPGTAPSDWELVEKNDQSRQARVRAMLDAGEVATARDYFHAGMVYQHATGADGVQLAHELAMISACMGEKDARWLAAASYDRMLMDLDRPQRFGTQYRSDDKGVTRLYQVSEGVTDQMRAKLNTPPLQKAKDRELEMQKMMEELRKTMKAPEGGGK